MISIISSTPAPYKIVDGVAKSRELFTLAGLSTDTKPVTEYKGILIRNGSTFIEIDTGKEYLYDEAGGEWHEQPEGDKKKDDPTAEEISVSRGSADAGKVIVVGNDGKLLPVDLEVGEGQIAVDGTLKIPGAAADAKKTGDALASLNGSLGTLKADLGDVESNLDKGHLPIINEFAIGTISSAGNCSYDNTKLNVISRTALCFARGIRLYVKSGFRFVIHYYSSSTMNSATWEQEKYNPAWNTAFVDIAADQYFNIVINKIGNAVTPDVNEFKSAVYIATKFQNQIEQNTNDILSLQASAATVADLEAEVKSFRDDYVQSLPFVIGGHAQNPWGITTNLKRITTANIIVPTHSGATITCDSGYQLYLSYYNDADEWMSNSGWVSEVTLLDRKFALTVRKETNEENITSVNDLLKHIHSDAYVGIITDLETEVRNGNPFPDYVNDELNTVLAECYNRYTSALVVFGFNTDQHITYDTANAKRVLYGLQALSKLTRYIPFNFVALGGDAAGYNYESGGVDSTQQGILEDVTEVMEPLYDAWCPVISITGNHDAYQNAEEQTDPITYQQIFQTYMKRAVIAKQVHNRDTVSTDCYIDDVTCNIRFIFVDDTNSTDTNYTDRVRGWLIEALSGLPENYNAVVISHRPQNSNLGSAFSGTRSNQDILNQYANRIICCVNGHSHKDGAEYLDGILYIETTCAMAGQNSLDGYTRTIGTASETAFDVYMIDTAEKKIYTVRYGAGSSREFIYDGVGAGQVTT